MEVRKVKKEVTVTEYVARDGVVFSDEAVCLRHEAQLTQKQAAAWVEKHNCLDLDDNLWCYITHDFPGDYNVCAYGVKVTAESIPHLLDLKSDDIFEAELQEELRGQVLILTEYEGDFRVWGTLPDLIHGLTRDLRQICRLKIKLEEEE